jgi:LmbE family N-acetylglucosaminyl deacetylase
MHAVWVTSGDYFGGRERREAELASAMRVLGLDKERTRLLRLPSLGLLAQLRQGCERVAEVMNEIQPDIVFVNAYEGGHPDHDAVNFLAYAGVRGLNPKPGLLEFPLYNGTGPVRYSRWRINSFPPAGPRVLYNPLDSEDTRCKYGMMRAYFSQWAYMIPARLACSRARMRHPGEPYRCCPEDRDHAVPPCSGRLNYERWFNRFLGTRFCDFREAVLSAREPR